LAPECGFSFLIYLPDLSAGFSVRWSVQYSTNLLDAHHLMLYNTTEQHTNVRSFFCMAERVDRVGQQIGDYRLIRKVGSGSFGSVYLGEQTHEQTQVAVKILQAKLTQSQDLKEFINEARVMRLKHPHILPLLDFGVDEDDIPFLVMPYADGGTLRDRHARGTRLPLATVVSYVTPLASALSYAHSLHLIHRDVKPENILLGSNNEIWLSDFGIVAVALSTHSVGVQQSVGGTLPYMAPEQIQGKPRTASDQYALGILVYEWLCGKRPFQGTNVEIATQHIMVPPVPLREHLPTLASNVEQVVLTALAKDPKQRFASVEAFATALRSASQQLEPSKPLPTTPISFTPSMHAMPLAPIHDKTRELPNKQEAPATQISFPPPQGESASIMQPLITLPATPPVATISTKTNATFSAPQGATAPFQHQHQPQRPRISRRTKILLASLILLVMLASVLGISATIYFSTVRHQQATMQAANAAYNTYVSSNGIMFGFNAAHTHVNPYEQVLNPTNVATLTKLWSYHPSNAFSSSPPIVTGSSSPVVVNGVLYIGSDDGNIYALDSATGSQKGIYATGGSLLSSPAVVNGVLYIGTATGFASGDVYALDTVTGTKKWVYHASDDVSSSPTLVNGILYVGSDDGNVYALNSATGSKKWAYYAGDFIFSAPAVVNGAVYFGANNGNIYALDSATGKDKWAYHTGNAIFSSPTLANGVLYVGCNDGNVYALDSATSTKKWTYHTGNVISSSPAIANGVLYVGSNDGNVYALDSVTGAKKWVYHTGDAVSSSPTIANGVLYIGSNDGNIYALDSATGAKKWAYHTGGAISSSPTIANGVLYISSADGNVYAFHLAGGVA
jgi:eukaryotic-like serine/threonine-protein kinase